MMTPKAVATRRALDAAEVEKLSDDEIDAAIQAYRRERSRRAIRYDLCGAPYPERPGTTCRREPGHSGEHATARRDVQWDNSYLSAPAVLHSTDENAEIVKNAAPATPVEGMTVTETGIATGWELGYHRCGDGDLRPGAKARCSHSH